MIFLLSLLRQGSSHPNVLSIVRLLLFLPIVALVKPDLVHEDFFSMRRKESHVGKQLKEMENIQSE